MSYTLSYTYRVPPEPPGAQVVCERYAQDAEDALYHNRRRLACRVARFGDVLDPLMWSVTGSRDTQQTYCIHDIPVITFGPVVHCTDIATRISRISCDVLWQAPRYAYSCPTMP